MNHTKASRTNGKCRSFEYQPRPIEMWEKRFELPLRGINSRPLPEQESPKRGKSAAGPTRNIDGSLQENILTLLCFDTESCQTIIDKVDTDNFHNEVYRTIADRAKASFRKYKKAPGRGHLADLVEKELLGKNARIYADTLRDLYHLSESIDRQFVLDQLQEFVDRQVCIQAITRAAEAGRTADAVSIKAQLLKDLEPVGNPQSDGLLGLDGAALAYKEFRNTEFPPVVLALNPTLPHPGIVQINGFRGDFKSGLGHYMLVGLGAGVDVFGWKCKRPYKVLLVDGEMPLATVKKRLAGVCADLGVNRQLVDRNLTVLDRSKLNRRINLADPSQFAELVEYFTQFEIVGLDNIKSLVSGVDLNTGIGWETIDALCMRCRDDGTSIVREQHKGKDPNAGSRGASDQEDHVDVVIDVKKTSQTHFTVTLLSE